jgi:hypothetical protein
MSQYIPTGGVQSRPLIMRERVSRGFGADDQDIEIPNPQCARAGEVRLSPTSCAPPLLQSAVVFAGIAAVFYYFGRR